MKITKTHLKQIIKEELEAVLKERSPRLTSQRRGAPSQAQEPSEQEKLQAQARSKCKQLKQDLEDAHKAHQQPVGQSDEWHTQAALSSAEAAWKEAGCVTRAKCTELKGVMGSYKPENSQELKMVRKCKELYSDI